MPAGTERVRVDTGFGAGDDVSPFYDPMLAKLIVWGEDRAAACAQMLAALAGCEVAGVSTNIAFLERVVAHEAFASGRVDTGLIDKHRDALFPPPGDTPPRALLAAAAAEYAALRDTARASASVSGDPHSPWHVPDAFWNGTVTHAIRFTFADGDARHDAAVRPRADGAIDVMIGDRSSRIAIAHDGDRLVVDDGGERFAASVVAAGEERFVFAPGTRRRLRLVDPLAHAGEDEAHGGHLTAPMSGTVVAVMVEVGDKVEKGAPLVILEAMKMEHTIAAPAAGVVAAVHFAVGDRVSEGADLVDVDDA